jgi:hypothetical protein
VRLKVSVRRGVSPHFFRGEGREVAEKGAGLTPAPSAPDTFNRTPSVASANHPPNAGAASSASQTAAPAAARPGLPRQWRIRQILYMESPMVEDAARGFRAGLKEAGLRDRTDFSIQTLSAQAAVLILAGVVPSTRRTEADFL